jgi:uncharacterized protein (UPF0276 family)
MKESQTVIGAGPEWIESLGDELIDQLDRLSCIELIPENFFDYPDRVVFLDKLKDAGTPVLVHAVGLSLATDEPLKSKHLDKVLAIADRVNTLNLSEHLSMTEAGGIDIGQLTPVPWTIKSADVVIRKIEQIQKLTSLPFAFEHVAYRFFYPSNELTEPEFINRILDRTGCSLMLDLHNLYCNSKNADYDPLIWLEEIKIDKVTSIHLAGGFQTADGTYQDGHNQAVPEPVWDLLNHVLQKVTPQVIIVERTGNYPGVEAIMSEVSRAETTLRSSIEERQ